MCYQAGSLVLIQGFSGKRPGSGVPVVSVDQGSRIINLRTGQEGRDWTSVTHVILPGRIPGSMKEVQI